MHTIFIFVARIESLIHMKLCSNMCLVKLTSSSLITHGVVQQIIRAKYIMKLGFALTI